MGTLHRDIWGPTSSASRKPKIPSYVRGLVYVTLLLVAQFALVGVIYLETSEKVLFSGLSSDDVAEVSAFLKDKGITYRISDGGSTVLVKGKVEHLQKEFELTESKIAQSHKELVKSITNELDAKLKQDPHRMDAIRKDLEQLLTNGSERIAWARVGFAHNEMDALEEGEGKKGAAVFVGTHGQTLPPVDVERIQWVVANSFAGLKPTDVTVLDEVGRELTSTVRD